MTDIEWTAFETRLRRYVGNRVDSRWVDDVVGDILLKLVRNRDAVSKANNPLAFVLRAASNAIADHYRRKSAEQRKLADLENEISNPEISNSSPDDEITAELAQCVQPFIESLPDKYRNALLLTEINGLSQSEAARQLGISISGMKSRVQRGRIKMKEALLDCCTIELDRRGGIMDYETRTSNCGNKC